MSDTPTARGMKAPRRSCRCLRAYDLCPACLAWGARHKRGQHYSYRGIPRRTWATAQDVREITRLRGLGYPWVQVVELTGITSGALRAVRRLGLVPTEEDTA
jgi:hypothetical protein